MSGQATGDFEYDGNFKRVKQTLNNKTIYSVYGQSGALLFRDADTDNEATDYIRAGGTVVVRLANGLATYPHTDHLGSSVAATDTTGTVLWRKSHTPFGEIYQGCPGNHDDMSFTGHVQDAATGLTYMQARYYDPMIGRFLSNDPVPFAPSTPKMFNRYAYVSNDPVNGTDPTGRNRCNGGCGNFKPSVPALPAGFKRLLGETAVGFTPAGVALDVVDFGTATANGDFVDAGLAAIGFVPGPGDVFKGLGKAVRNSLAKVPKGGLNSGDYSENQINKSR